LTKCQICDQHIRFQNRLRCKHSLSKGILSQPRMRHYGLRIVYIPPSLFVCSTVVLPQKLSGLLSLAYPSLAWRYFMEQTSQWCYLCLLSRIVVHYHVFYFLNITLLIFPQLWKMLSSRCANRAQTIVNGRVISNIFLL